MLGRPNWWQTTPVASTERSKYMDRSLRQSQASCTWALITDEGSKHEILSRIAQTAAALTGLKPVWNDSSICLSSKTKPMHSLVTSIFLYACESWTLTVELQNHGNEVLCKILCISYKNHVTNEEVHAMIQQAIGPHEDLLAIVKRCKLQWYGHVSCSFWPKPSCKAQRKGEADKADRGRGGKTSRNGQAWSSPHPRGQRRTAKKWRKLVVKSSVVPQWPLRLRDRQDEIAAALSCLGLGVTLVSGTVRTPSWLCHRSVKWAKHPLSWCYKSTAVTLLIWKLNFWGPFSCSHCMNCSPAHSFLSNMLLQFCAFLSLSKNLAMFLTSKANTANTSGGHNDHKSLYTYCILYRCRSVRLYHCIQFQQDKTAPSVSLHVKCHTINRRPMFQFCCNEVDGHVDI